MNYDNEYDDDDDEGYDNDDLYTRDVSFRQSQGFGIGFKWKGDTKTFRITWRKFAIVVAIVAVATTGLILAL